MKANLDFLALHTRDLAAARAYYTRTLGFEVAQERPGAVVFAHGGGAEFAVREPLPGVDGTQPFGVGVSVWLGVPDAEAYHGQVVAAGARVVQPPQDGPFGRMFTLVTPDGHALTFHQTE
ncbi:glyoxalase [Deinococcus aetherius]|uniref:Glyoxalase n=1 Tax=Deinococcus aetherius TaxID=200252 RepID=A0ABM8AHF4_9DEIO|nr:VOC family protein [Deinococcus aetherius]BDP43227.1 glyoxalase [Deinococcus aetherius]